MNIDQIINDRCCRNCEYGYLKGGHLLRWCGLDENEVCPYKDSIDDILKEEEER